MGTNSRRSNTQSIIRALGKVTIDDTEITNIFHKINIHQPGLADADYYEEYIIEDTDRWDIISNKIYGTPYLYWLILIFNDIKDPFSSLNAGDTLNIIKPELVPGLLLKLRA